MSWATSLVSAKRSSNFEVVIDLSVFGSSLARDLSLLSEFVHNLDIDFLLIVQTHLLTIFLIHSALSVLDDLTHSVIHILSLFNGILIMSASQEGVVLFVHEELHRVLIVGEEGVVSVAHIGQASIEVEHVLDWRLVLAWLEPKISESHGLEILKDFVTHGELFAGSADVSVVVVDSES